MLKTKKGYLHFRWSIETNSEKECRLFLKLKKPVFHKVQTGEEKIFINYNYLK